MAAQGKTRRNRRLPAWAAALLGGIVLVAAWWLLSVTAFTPAPGTTFTPVPSPPAVVQWLFIDGNIGGAWGVFQPTITEAALGFLWGNALALLLASTVLLLPRLEPIITQVAVVSYCLPVVAVGGIAIVVLGGAKRPGDPSSTAIFLAALAVFFTTVVGALLGFKSADKASLDVVRVWTIFLMCAIVALVGYLVVGLLARLVTPWVSGRNP